MESKLSRLRAFLNENKVDSIVLTSVDQIAWLYNLRAHDIPNFPVALAYSIVSLDSASIYMDASRLDELSEEEFRKNNVTVCGYNDIYSATKTLSGSVLVDPSSVNYAIVSNLRAKPVFKESPIILWKALKNETELKCTKWAHIKDGVAVTKFMYWLKKNAGKIEMSEMSVQSKLQVFRSEQENYLEDSFDFYEWENDEAACDLIRRFVANTGQWWKQYYDNYMRYRILSRYLEYPQEMNTERIHQVLGELLLLRVICCSRFACRGSLGEQDILDAIHWVYRFSAHGKQMGQRVHQMYVGWSDHTIAQALPNGDTE